MKKTYKTGATVYKINTFLWNKRFKLVNGIWYSWHNEEWQPFWTTPKTHSKHIYHLKQVMAR